MSTIHDPNIFLEAIRSAVKAEIRAVVDEEVKEAQARVAKRVGEAADAIALRVLARYDVEMGRDHLLISVKKETQP